MTIRLLSEAAGGAAYCYHVSPSLGEHFWVGKVRRNARATFLTCALCDGVTSIPRTDANADHRAVEALIARGVTPLVIADDAMVDPLQAGKDDGNIPATTVIPQDTAGRTALRKTLRAAHIDKRPAGTRFQKRIGNIVEVHEDVAGTGVTVVRERWIVGPDGAMTRVES